MALWNKVTSRIYFIKSSCIRITKDANTNLRPISQVRVWSRTLASARKFAGEIGAKACATAEEAVAGADVICTVTFSTTPIIKASWIKDGAHINGRLKFEMEWLLFLNRYFAGSLALKPAGL